MLGVILVSTIAVTLTLGTIETVRRAFSSPPGGTPLRDAKNWVKSPKKGPGQDAERNPDSDFDMV